MAVKKKAGSKSKIVDDDAWITVHFEELVDKYAGEYVLIARGKVFPVSKEKDVVELEKEIKRKYGVRPIGMPIPTPRDLIHILFFFPS